MKRPTLFGGSFDPFHSGHQTIALAAVAAGFHPLFVVPAHQVSGKSLPIASGEDRLSMSRLAVEGMEGVEVSSEEIDRGGISYTVDTIRRLAARFPACRPALLLGGDAALSLPTWREGKALMALADILVALRPGYPAPPFPATTLAIPPLSLSASSLRQILERGEDPGEALHPAVWSHIHLRGLYT